MWKFNHPDRALSVGETLVTMTGGLQQSDVSPTFNHYINCFDGEMFNDQSNEDKTRCDWPCARMTPTTDCNPVGELSTGKKEENIHCWPLWCSNWSVGAFLAALRRPWQLDLWCLQMLLNNVVDQWCWPVILTYDIETGPQELFSKFFGDPGDWT